MRQVKTCFPTRRFPLEADPLHQPPGACAASRCDVVGIFPNSQAALRLIGAVLEEQQDEWEAGRRHFSQASMAALYGIHDGQETSPEEVLTG